MSSSASSGKRATLAAREHYISARGSGRRGAVMSSLASSGKRAARAARAHYISARGSGRRGSHHDDAVRRADVDPRAPDAGEHDVPVGVRGTIRHLHHGRVTRCGMVVVEMVGVVGAGGGERGACLTRLSEGSRGTRGRRSPRRG